MNPEAILKIPNQRGAVLAFSLVMLLLLTLVSVSMIQQNKQELAMAGNALDQTKTLASAETQLKLAELSIDQIRYALSNLGDPIRSDLKCDNSHSIPNGTTLDNGSTLGNAKVTAVSCLRNKEVTPCPTGNLNDASSPECTCPQLNGTEIYTLSTVTNSNSGSQRTVESKYAVDCSGGTF
ncbi:MAG: PilX N-terminal domain-containing pilus assembly protein [Gammaproteobacteria bacterium]